MEINRVATEAFEDVVAVWEASVRATHGFVAEIDLCGIREKLVTDYLPGVEIYVLVDVTSNRIAAFAGISRVAEDIATHGVAHVDGDGISGGAYRCGRVLEMLFVHPDFMGCGCGTRLLDFSVREKGVVAVDVNEQNEAALQFYLDRGFRIDSRSPKDDCGRDYPVLHLVLCR